MRALLVAFLFAAVSLTPGVVAEHPEMPDDGGSTTMAFDHRGGNEWWVEVRLAGPAADANLNVFARDDGGSWKALAKRDWGNWAGSFHIEPGHRVQFKAVWQGSTSDVATWTSCWFTHPAGVEECDEAPPPGDFDATFSGAKGNSWWIQVKVAATGGTLAGVDVRLDGGDWKPLRFRDWGAWAASYHAPEGTVVQFRARSTGGAEDLSGCYRWTSATPTECRGTVTPPSGFDATFSSVKGNEWWVEVKVSANEPLAGVDVRTDADIEWRPLTKKSWGAWAASFHIENRTHVQFRARAVDGDFERSGCWMWYPPKPGSCGYLWPLPGDFLKTRLVTTSTWEGHDETMWANVTYEAEGSSGGWTMVYTCAWDRRVTTPEGATWSSGVVKADGGMPSNRNAVTVGETIGIQAPVGCGTRSWADAAIVERTMDVPTWIFGRATTVDGWEAGDAPGGAVTVHDLEWESTLGLTLRWDVAFTDEHGAAITSKGEVVDASGPYQ